MELFILGLPVILVCLYVIYLYDKENKRLKKLNEKLDLIDKENKRLKKIIFDLTGKGTFS